MGTRPNPHIGDFCDLNVSASGLPPLVGTRWGWEPFRLKIIAYAYRRLTSVPLFNPCGELRSCFCMGGNLPARFRSSPILTRFTGRLSGGTFGWRRYLQTPVPTPTLCGPRDPVGLGAFSSQNWRSAADTIHGAPFRLKIIAYAHRGSSPTVPADPLA